jgi:hypothetical protein
MKSTLLLPYPLSECGVASRGVERLTLFFVHAYIIVAAM